MEHQDSPAKSTAQFDNLTDALRSRVDLFGKGLAALATVGTGAVGLTTVSDLAPRGPGSSIAALAALGGLFFSAICAIKVAGRLMQVNQPVVLEADDTPEDFPKEIGFDDTAGLKDLARIYSSTAERFGYSSLAGLSERERDLRRTAARALTEAERLRRTALADEVAAAIEHALARARWAIVRRRASDAASGQVARQLYVGVAAGLLTFTFLSDVATSNQSDNIDTAKACAEAREAGALDDDLRNTKCARAAKADGSESDTVTAPKARHLLVDQLAAVLDACYTLTNADTVSETSSDPGKPLEPESCDPIKDAIDTMLQR